MHDQQFREYPRERYWFSGNRTNGLLAQTSPWPKLSEGMDGLDSDMKRAIRTALRSLEAAQSAIVPHLAVEHLAGAVQQLTFVVSQLTNELIEIKKRGD